MTKTATLTTVFKVDRTDFDRGMAGAKRALAQVRKAAVLPPGFKQAAGVAHGLAKSVGSRMLTFGFYGAVGGVAALTRSVVQFDTAAKKANANFMAGGEDVTESYKRLYDVTTAVGKATEHTSAAAAEGAATFAQAGYTSQELAALLPQTADLATAAGVDIKTAADWATNALNTFGMRVQDAPEQTAKSFARVSDTISLVVAQGKLDFADYNNTLSYTGQVARGLGLSLEDVSASIGLMSLLGLKHSKAGTNLRAMYLRLANPVGSVKDKMEELGVSAFDASGNFKPLAGTMAELGMAMKAKGWNLEQRIGFLNQLFPRTAMPGGVGMTTFDMKAVDEYMDKLGEVNGLTGKMAGIMRNSLAGQMERLWSNFEALAITVVDRFRPQIDAFFKSAIKWASEIDPDEIAFFFGQIWSGIKEMGPAIKGAIPDMKEFTKNILGAAIELLKVLGPMLKEVTPYIGEMLMVWAGAKGAQAAMSIKDMAVSIASAAAALKWGIPLLATVIGLLGGPFTLIVIAVAALIAICHQKWQDWINSLWDTMGPLQKVAQYMKEIANVLNEYGGFFGFNNLDMPVTRKQLRQEGIRQWEEQYAKTGVKPSAMENLGLIWDREIPQDWQIEALKKTVFYGEQKNWAWQLPPEVPYGMEYMLPGAGQGPGNFDVSGPLPTGLEDAIAVGMRSAAPNIYITANDGVQVSTNTKSPGNNAEINFNGKGRN